MTNLKATKKALVSSVLALVMCFTMLLGTTFAWFTDTVTSANNVIQTGTLDIGLSYKGLNETTWTDIADENGDPVFNYQYWEPGYTDAKYVRISNNGTLAFKYQLNIVPNIVPAVGEVNLADVIDVYMFPADATVDKAAIAAATPVGTLSDLMAENDGAAHGVLLPAEGMGSTNVHEDNAPVGEVVYCIVLKMREDAGNEYQNLSVGEGFALQLVATQYTWENDSFDHLYDEGADFDAAPKANVQATSGKWIDSSEGRIWANATFQFQPEETLEQALVSPYQLYHADFVVYADGEIVGDSLYLAGYYKAYADDQGNGNWICMSSSDDIEANTKIRLIQHLGATVNYEDICRWGNDGIGFLCGVSAVADENGNYIVGGTTITVELRLYEVPAAGECEKAAAEGTNCHHDDYDCELGEDKYITIGTYKYTIPETTADRTPDPLNP